MNIRTKLAIRYALAGSLGRLRRRNESLRILTFHSVQAHPNTMVHMPPEAFEEQIRYLAEQGYATCRIRDLVEAWPAIADRKRTVVLTFDDGCANNRTIVCPILERYGMTATFFVATAGIGESRQAPSADGLAEYRDTEFLSWTDLREMAAAGFEIGAHSHRHVMVARQDRERAREEIALPKKLLEDRLGGPVCSFAYPKGHADAFADWTRPLLAEAGYRAGCTMMGGPISARCDLYELPRTGIHPTDDLKRFRMKLDGRYDLLRRL